MIDEVLLGVAGTNSTFNLTRRTDFIGYNYYTYIDVTNVNPFNDLNLCTEGQFFDETSKLCGGK